jgi:hypothetical protein
MAHFSLLVAVLAFASAISACGEGAQLQVTGGGSAFIASSGGTTIYTGPNYLLAVQAAVNRATAGQHVAVMASGSVGTGSILLKSNIIFEGCGTINAARGNGNHGAVDVQGATNVRIPTLTMTGSPYFGIRIAGSTGVVLGDITMTLSGGIGIRTDPNASSRDITMNTVRVTGAGEHAIEVWNINGLTIGSVTASNCGGCALLIQATTNARVTTVSGTNVGTLGGYATLRFANRNGRDANGAYPAGNINIGRVISRASARGVFCVSESGGATISSVDIAGSREQSILIENCYNMDIRGGVVSDGAPIRVADRANSGFRAPDNVSISVTTGSGVSLAQSCSATNIRWTINGQSRAVACT